MVSGKISMRINDNRRIESWFVVRIGQCVVTACFSQKLVNALSGCEIITKTMSFEANFGGYCIKWFWNFGCSVDCESNAECFEKDTKMEM